MSSPGPTRQQSKKKSYLEKKENWYKKINTEE